MVELVDGKGSYKSIMVPSELKLVLDGLKVHPREPYFEVIGRLVKEHGLYND